MFISSLSSSLSSFFPLPITFPVFAALLTVVVFYFLNWGSEFVLPRVELASLFFLGVVIKFSYED